MTSGTRATGTTRYLLPPTTVRNYNGAATPEWPITLTSNNLNPSRYRFQCKTNPTTSVRTHTFNAYFLDHSNTALTAYTVSLNIYQRAGSGTTSCSPQCTSNASDLTCSSYGPCTCDDYTCSQCTSNQYGPCDGQCTCQAVNCGGKCTCQAVMCYSQCAPKEACTCNAVSCNKCTCNTEACGGYCTCDIVECQGHCTCNAETCSQCTCDAVACSQCTCQGVACVQCTSDGGCLAYCACDTVCSETNYSQMCTLYNGYGCDAEVCGTYSCPSKTYTCPCNNVCTAYSV